MAGDLIFPTSAELSLIAQDKLPRLTAQRPVFSFFPIDNIDQWQVMWEQQDNFAGLQQVRGLNGAPPRVLRTGAKRYQMTPGVYGEYELVDEAEITTRRQYGTFGNPIDLSDVVVGIQDHLLGRRLDRIEWIIWTLLSTGTFSVASNNGAVTHTDVYSPQTYAAATSWATFATATPLADLRAVKLLARGHSVSFGPDAQLFANAKTVNNMLSNTNSADLYGRRTAGLGTFNSISQVNELFMADNLPSVMEYDEGYFVRNGVTSIAVGAGGSSYTSAPTVNFVVPAGSTAPTATATVSGGVVTTIAVVNNGGPFDYAPAITLTGGGGSGATATATIGNVFKTFIPDNTAILVGRRPGNVPVGHYYYVRNANNPGATPGAYMKVVDTLDRAVPRNVEVHDGHSGGPSLEYGSAIVTLTV